MPLFRSASGHRLLDEHGAPRGGDNNMELRAVISLAIDEEKLSGSHWSLDSLQTYFTHLLETTINEQMPDIVKAHFIQTKKETW